MIARLVIRPWLLADTAMQVSTSVALATGFLLYLLGMVFPLAMIAGSIGEPYADMGVYVHHVIAAAPLTLFLLAAFVGLPFTLAWFIIWLLIPSPVAMGASFRLWLLAPSCMFLPLLFWLPLLFGNIVGDPDFGLHAAAKPTWMTTAPVAIFGSIAWWPVMLLTTLAWLTYGALRLTKLSLRAAGLCETCGYNLFGNVSGRCPECGTIVPPTTLQSAPPKVAVVNLHVTGVDINGTEPRNTCTRRTVMDQVHRVKISEVYRISPPPFPVAKSVTRLLNSIPSKYLAGLDAVLITNGHDLTGDRKRHKTWSLGKKIRIRSVQGLYHKKWGHEPAWIELFIDNISRDWPRWLWSVGIVRDLLLAEVLFHELGHHVHASSVPEHREPEAVADKWSRHFSQYWFRKRYWILWSLLLPFRPALRYLGRRFAPRP